MMTPRPLARTRRAAAVLTIAATGLLMLAGCDPRTLIYFLQPFDPTIPPQFTGSLKGKKVVILTHAAIGTMNDTRSTDRELTQELTKILREKVKKIEIVDHRKVADWVESHPNWSEAAEAARFFDADMVIFLEIEHFRIDDPSSPGLYKGMARVHIQVTEMQYPKNSKGKPETDKAKEPEEVYDGQVDTEFPSRGPMPADSGISRGGFHNKFLKLVATEVSWHFVDRAYGDDIQDTRVYD